MWTCRASSAASCSIFETKPSQEEIDQVLAEAKKEPMAKDVADIVTLLLHTGNYGRRVRDGTLLPGPLVKSCFMLSTLSAPRAKLMVVAERMMMVVVMLMLFDLYDKNNSTISYF